MDDNNYLILTKVDYFGRCCHGRYIILVVKINHKLGLSFCDKLKGVLFVVTHNKKIFIYCGSLA